MSLNLDHAYRHCEQVARRSRSTFFLAFGTLPRRMYRQMCVLYAFMRQTDDLSDEESVPIETRRTALQQWKTELSSALTGGECQDPILIALADVAQQQQISPQLLLEVVDGVAGDLTPRTFETFSELEQYCYQVAGVVGICCLKIWGSQGEENIPAAIACGTAFQMTNILRDLVEDADRGRIYLPQTDMNQYEYSVRDLQARKNTDSFRQLIRFQVDRTWTFYREALPLESSLSAPGRRIFLAFFELYNSLLRQIEKRNYDVLSERIHLSRWQKVSVALRCFLKWNCRIQLPAHVMQKSLAARHNSLLSSKIVGEDGSLR